MVRAGEPFAFVISITPFDGQGRVDEHLLRAQLRRFAEAGIGVYLIGSGSGEGYTLSAADRRRVLEIGVEELKGKVPVRAMGVEPRTASEMIAFLELAKTAGVDAAQVYSLDVGHGHPPTPSEIEAYLRDVVGATDFPLVLSTHQSVGYRVPVGLIGELARDNAHVIEVNCSHQDLGYLAATIDATKGHAGVFVGGPMQSLTGWALGAQGYLTSEGNLAPNLCMALVHALRRGDLADALETYNVIIRLSAALYGNGAIRATKAVMQHFGLPGGWPHTPRLPLDADQLRIVLKMLDALKLNRWEDWVSAR